MTTCPQIALPAVYIKGGSEAWLIHLIIWHIQLFGLHASETKVSG